MSPLTFRASRDWENGIGIVVSRTKKGNCSEIELAIFLILISFKFYFRTKVRP